MSLGWWKKILILLCVSIAATGIYIIHGIREEDAKRTVWIENNPESNPFNGLEIPQDVLNRMEKRSSWVQAQQPQPPSLPPVKLNTESITPLSREKLRFHEDIVRSLLN